MTIEEFSNHFDTLFNTLADEGTLPLDEYEKSILLTHAQEDLILDWYSGITTDGFESTEQARRALDALLESLDITLGDKSDAIRLKKQSKALYQYDVDVHQAVLDKQKSSTEESSTDDIIYRELMYILYESAEFNDSSLCASNATVEIVPIRYDELHRVVNNPFRGPSDTRVIRTDTGWHKVALVSSYELGTYHIEFLYKPKPIILATLEDGTSIDGYTEPMTSELDASVHKAIVVRAVTMALANKQKNSNGKQ